MVVEKIEQLLNEALRRAREQGELPEGPTPESTVQPPPSLNLGDYASNLALALGSQTGQAAREVAQVLLRHMPQAPDLVERVELAGAGFINFRLRPGWLHEAVLEACRLGERCGRSDRYAGHKVNIEFVSANPSGPILVVNGRAAAMGGALANLLEFVGWQVTREYYVNDALVSTQMERLGESLEARYFQALGIDKAVPEDGYQGEYLVAFAQEIVRERGDAYLKMGDDERRRQFTTLALEKMLADQKRDLEDFGVRYEVWFRESSLYDSRKVEKAIGLLTERGYTYESEGALWLRSTALGAEKDEVLVRGTGKPAYLAGDIAYHMDKFGRGFDRLIDIWGPDHHGHVARLKAGVRASGCDADRLEILVHQIVRLVSEGEQVRMSKRAGDIVPLSDLVREVGSDAARFFFLMRSHDTPLDFDLELAKRHSLDNPVYYVQYAHARICSIFAEAERKGVPLPAPESADLSCLTSQDERALMRKIADFPDEVMAAAEKHEPHRLTRFAQEFAEVFHKFYTNCRVLGSGPGMEPARLLLAQAARNVLRNVLGLTGISAPERM
jgi:arginyl-tRNA synthetase